LQKNETLRLKTALKKHEMKRKPADGLAIGLVAIAALCCVCIVLAWTALDAVGWVVSAPFRFFQRREPAERTLRGILEDGGEAAFALGEDCEFTYAQGTAIRAGGSGEGDEFSTELSRPEVIAAVAAALQEELFQVRDGGVALGSGAPVRTSFLTGEAVSLGFDEESASDISVVSRSLEAVAEGNTLTGAYHASESISTVVDGQGIEESITLDADFTCPIRWIASE
jgi:hypothetical protein